MEEVVEAVGEGVERREGEADTLPLALGHMEGDGVNDVVVDTVIVMRVVEEVEGVIVEVKVGESVEGGD